MPGWLFAVLRVLGIRSVADVVPVATKVVEQVREVVDPEEPGQPLPYTAVRHIEGQIESATSHKVPPTKPRTGNPARVVAASAPGRPAPFASPPEGGGAAGTQGVLCRHCGGATVPWAASPVNYWWCARCMFAGPIVAPGPGLAKAVDRTLITPREGTRIVPPRPVRKEPDK